MIRNNMIGKKFLLFFVFIISFVDCIEYDLITTCSSITNNNNNTNGIRVRMTKSEFFDSYISMFEMSDGSNIDTISSDQTTKMTLKGSSLNYTSALLRLVGVEEVSDEKNINDNSMMTFQICGMDMVEIFMLSIVGNFVVTSPSKDENNGVSSNGLASVVIDVYTGRLTLVNSFSVVRSYFLETMLIISILAIAKLTIIRNVKVRVEFIEKPSSQMIKSE